MVRIKRRWVPEWLFAVLAWPVDLISPKWLPFRWILTKPVPPPPVQVQLMPDRTPNLEQKQTKGTEGCPRRQHHSRGNREERGKF